MSDPADPSTWPMLVKLLAGWGPLGIWAGWAELRRIWAERAHHATRDGHEAAAAALNERNAQALREVNEEIARIRDEHEAQLREVANRFIRIVERQSKETRALVDKVDEKKPKE